MNARTYECRCPKHGAKHQLRKGHGLCAHPECVFNLIHRQSKSSPAIRDMLRRIYEYGEVDDYVAYVLYRLVRCVEPVLSKQRTIFYTQDFLNQKTVEKPKLAAECPFTPELEEAIVEESQLCLTYTPGCHQYRHTLAGEVMDYIADTHGEHWTLYLSEGIGVRDLARLEGIKSTKVREFAGEVAVDVELWATRRQ